MGHRAKDLHSRVTRTCFNCGQKGHLTSSCRKGQQKSSSGGCASGQSSNHSSADFSFGAFRAGRYDKESIELLIDSGCNCFMIKNKELFSDLDEGFRADVCNANSSRSEIRGRGTVRCSVKDNTGRSCLLELRDAFWVPSYARNLVSVKRLTDKGAVIQFNDDPTIKMPNGTVVPMMTNDELFIVMAHPVETGSLAIVSHDVSFYQALASCDGAQQLARCGEVAARSREHEHLWLRKEDELQHLLHREGEAGIYSENVVHLSENETGYRPHRRARTHSAGVSRGFSLCSGLHRQLQSFRGSIPNEVKG